MARFAGGANGDTTVSEVPLPPDHPGLNPNHPVLLFDGVCNLCSGAVQYIVRRQPSDTNARGTFRFAPLQSPVAERLLGAINEPPPSLDSMIVIDGGRAYQRSDAAVVIARHLRYPWRLLAAFGWIPRPLREALYRWVARNRYRWFGKKDACMMPTADLEARFL